MQTVYTKFDSGAPKRCSKCKTETVVEDYIAQEHESPWGEKLYMNIPIWRCTVCDQVHLSAVTEVMNTEYNTWLLEVANNIEPSTRPI